MSTFDISMACIAEIFGDFKFKDFARLGDWEKFVQGLLIKSLRVGNVNGMWDGISGTIETLHSR